MVAALALSQILLQLKFCSSCVNGAAAQQVVGGRDYLLPQSTMYCLLLQGTVYCLLLQGTVYCLLPQ